MTLIDADKLIEDITNTINEWIKEMPDEEYLKGNVNFAEMAKEIVRNQPIAFDVKKVVSELEDYKMWKELLIYDLDFRERQIIKKAIDIVKRGGV